MVRISNFQSITASLSAIWQRFALARGGAKRRLRLSLRTKGLLVLTLLVLYAIGVGLFVGQERVKLLRVVQQLDQNHADTESLVKINDGLMHSLVALQLALASDDYRAQRPAVVLDVHPLLPALARLAQHSPEATPKILAFEERWTDSTANWTLANLAALRDAEQQLAAQIERLEGAAEARGTELLDAYRASNHNITFAVSALNFTGLVLFGATVIWFLSRLAADIEQVEARATAIVGGYRGPALDVKRGDEVGSLIDSINRIQSELSISERTKELSRQQRLHQEKMAAVGLLAAAVAHEVNNPINSISGIAQYTIEAMRSQRPLAPETLRRNAEMTLQQTERLAAIVRHLSDMGASRSHEPELLDLNALTESTCSFVRYDPRFRHIELAFEPDASIPSVRTVADHVVQVLMNLLINAADALVASDAEKRVVRVEAHCADGAVELTVKDNGHGMEPAVLARAFEEFFTTKPAATGRGVGLYLCRTLMTELGGSIDLRSVPGVGTTATVRLPARQEA
jgi:two-component system, NtrC family, sensor kinase